MMNEDELLFNIENAELLYQQMLDLSNRQKEFALSRGWEKAGMHEFNRLLDERQKVINRIDKIKFKIDEIINKNGADNLSETAAEALQKQQKECRSITAKIQANDTASREALEKGKDQAAASLAKVRNSKKVNKAYAQPGSETAWFFDKKR